MAPGSAVGETIVSGQLLLAIPLAVLAGLVSFASPCVLPVVPGYLGLVGAVAQDAPAKVPARQSVGAASGPAAAAESSSPASRPADQPEAKRGLLARLTAGRGRVAFGATLFVLGFSVIYVLFGVASGFLGKWFLRYGDIVTPILGVIVVLMGVVFIGQVSFLQRSARMRFAPAGLLGAPLLGVIFGVGWLPCVGPTLATIQALSYTLADPGRGALLAFFYCIGLGLPFVLVALGIGRVTTGINWVRKHIRTINLVGGGILILIGFLMVIGVWQHFMSAFAATIGGYVPAL
ncbi:cytochrome c biogenesis protein CcdA [Pseudoclavibacter sp. RFBG4]|uniref:cytochrome c biogenesis CcdA family protein n=1 Tax=Pseudoclavibacter sp. RFBG4 TaxID=2080575 RepID=UPI0015E47107